MLGLLGKIFGSEKVIQSGIELIDSFHTSTEEQIEAATKSKVALLEAYQPFKLAQRVIAFAFTFIHLAFHSRWRGKGNLARNAVQFLFG